MKVTTGKIAWLCFVWCALLLLGLTIDVNVPFVLAVAGTILYLIG